MRPADIGLCAAFALCLPVGQVMFKWAALRHGALQGPLVLRLARNWRLAAAGAWYGATALFWFFILTRTPLTQAYPFSILGSALVPVAAWLAFKEPLSWRFAAGYALILTGFAVIWL